MSCQFGVQSSVQNSTCHSFLEMATPKTPGFLQHRACAVGRDRVRVQVHVQSLDVVVDSAPSRQKASGSLEILSLTTM